MTIAPLNEPFEVAPLTSERTLEIHDAESAQGRELNSVHAETRSYRSAVEFAVGGRFVRICRSGPFPSALTKMNIAALHPFTRERLIAILLLSRGPPDHCASQVCRTLVRDAHTVLQWVHAFNARGLAALVYRHTGGLPPRRHALVPLLGSPRLGQNSPTSGCFCTAPASRCRFTLQTGRLPTRRGRCWTYSSKPIQSCEGEAQPQPADNRY